MHIRASVRNSQGEHQVNLSTNDNTRSLTIAPRATGYGSSVNGGELLFLALATCYCNDVYREAAKRGIRVEAVDVEVEGEFGAEGEGATNVRYHARIAAQADDAAIRALAGATDRVAEIQNTLRTGTPVLLGNVEAISV